MIKPALHILTEDLNAFLLQKLSLTDPVVLHNIAEDNASNTTSGPSDQIYLTLVNVEEETLLKNTAGYNPSLAPGTKQMPPMRINLYLLFSFKSQHYKDALDSLSAVMGYCQSKKVWNQQNTVVPAFNSLSNQDFEFTLDLHNISFEDSNNMWGNLGGRQLPFVIYKLRMVTLAQDLIQSVSGVVTQPITNVNPQ